MNRPSKRPARKIIVPWGDHVLNGRNVGRAVGTPMKLNIRIHASRAQQRREEYLKQQRQHHSHAPTR